MKSNFRRLKLLGWGLIWASALVLPMPAAELTLQTTQLFNGSGNCAFCHDQWGSALLDRRGRDVSLVGDWRGTMMAHSFKDPLWRARMEAEVEENSALKNFIEDKCLTCHAPMARTQAVRGRTGALSYARASQIELASDGVSCTLCHQIQPDNLGRETSFSGRYHIAGTREIFGPYPDIFPGPMMHLMNYEPKFGKHVHDSGLCATCHTLFTPILDADGKTIGQFPEQTPYLEWRNSLYAQRGKQCQDCHLPRLDEPVKISARPPWLGTQQPFWRHQFTGGNAFMLTLLADQAPAISANAAPEQFARIIRKTRAQLRTQTARLRASASIEEAALVIKVEVENLTGHKFPTGFPYRRAWLHVKVAGQRDEVLFESGGTDEFGRIRGLATANPPHHDKIERPDQVQIYQVVMADQQGRPTWSLLRAHSRLKDNRLPPRGFVADGPEQAFTSVRGQATGDANFNANGSGQDQVTYRIQLAAGAAPATVEIELLYQPVPPEAVATLIESDLPAARTFARLYSRADKTPERIQSLRLEL